METLWFWLVAASVAMYVVFDGFDIGAGILHFVVARTPQERARIFRVIGPYWDGNEVWLLAGGGTLYFAFPALYASGFSGFYLPLMMVLWLLIIRGISIEFRGHMENNLWQPFWDVGFSLASLLLAIFFGAALGNVVRGVPLNADGFFFEPLWVDFRVTSDAGILDWYTIAIGVAALLALIQHGALWIILKTDGEIRTRSRAIFELVWWAVIASTAAITWLSFIVQPHLQQRFSEAPIGYAFPALALASLAIARFAGEMVAFLASCAYLLGMLLSAAWGLYPYVLPSITPTNTGLTVHNAAAAAHGLQIGLCWWLPGMLLVTGYFVFTYRQFAGKVE